MREVIAVAGSGPFADDEMCRDFVENLVGLRAKLGWSQETLATGAHVSKGVVAMTESYQRKPQVVHGIAYDKAFGLTNMFAAKARVIQTGSFPAAFQDFPAHEATADDVYVWEHSFIPGLTQTKPYAYAVFGTLLNITDEEVERLVSARMSRQEALFGQKEGKRPRLWALVDESALYRPVGSAQVMYEQCMRLLDVSRLSHVSLAVVPYSAGGHIGLEGACTIAERDGYPRIVNLADLADGRVTEDPVITGRVALRFRSLQHEAMANGASTDTIARMAEIWKATARSGARAPIAAPAGDSA